MPCQPATRQRSQQIAPASPTEVRVINNWSAARSEMTGINAISKT
jgi:hypothetical protein